MWACHGLLASAETEGKLNQRLITLTHTHTQLHWSTFLQWNWPVLMPKPWNPGCKSRVPFRCLGQCDRGGPNFWATIVSARSQPDIADGLADKGYSNSTGGWYSGVVDIHISTSEAPRDAEWLVALHLPILEGIPPTIPPTVVSLELGKPAITWVMLSPFVDHGETTRQPPRSDESALTLSNYDCCFLSPLLLVI